MSEGPGAQITPDAVLSGVEAHAIRSPDAVAVQFGDDILTYGQLDRRANQLAHHLRRLGVGPDQLVGLCVERSLDSVVGLLGILRSGAAFLPLDPHYPADRLAFMLEDAEAPVLITHRATATQLDAFAGRRVDLDADAGPIADQPTTAPDAVATPQDLAYVIFTSGSTGRPKGVMTTRAALANYLQFVVRQYEITPGDVILALTSISFDPAVRDILAPLLCGARLIISSGEAYADPAAILDTIVRRDVTVILNIIPSLLEQIPRDRDVARQLRLVATCGEALRPPQARAARRVFPQARLIQQYGPTEAAGPTTFYEVPPRLQGARTPIGRPIPNTRVYVLDDALNPAPIGVSGEIYIAGAGLARGYLRRPDLTADRFVLDPHGASGERMYRTGDLARWRSDGDLEFLGRADHQVKIRGFRIELGEIEAALLDLPQVDQTVVVAREDAPGDQRLIAYVVTGEATEWDFGRIRSSLALTLPDHMLPQAFVRLPALPLTPNGKLDRAALPAPDPQAEPSRHTAPRNPVETQLAQIWAEVLRLDRVGVHDNFFELGGHSLLATKVIVRVRDQLGLTLPLRALFDHPTIEGTSLYLDRPAPAAPWETTPSCGEEGA